MLNISLSKVPILGWYSLLKIAELFFFGWFMKDFLKTHWQPSLFVLVIGMSLESIVAIVQFFHQGSINGFLYLFGERLYNGSTPGIANASIAGQLILRPYGTFPHPNVLAGYLVIVMTIVISMKYKVVSIKGVVLRLGLILATIALFLTLSRVAILLWVGILLFVFIQRYAKIIVKKRLFVATFIVGGFLIALVSLFFPLILSRFFSTSLSDESVVLREKLANDAIRMMLSSPFIGVGLHNFLVMLPGFDHAGHTVFTIQPVHNIFLLLGAETGIVGLLLLAVFVFYLYYRLFHQYYLYSPQYIGEFMKRHTHLPHRLRSKLHRMLTFVMDTNVPEKKQAVLFKAMLLTEVIILGMFDHYFLTIQQGQLLLVLVIGLCLSL